MIEFICFGWFNWFQDRFVLSWHSFFLWCHVLQTLHTFTSWSAPQLQRLGFSWSPSTGLQLKPRCCCWEAVSFDVCWLLILHDGVHVIFPSAHPIPRTKWCHTGHHFLTSWLTSWKHLGVRFLALTFLFLTFFFLDWIYLLIGAEHLSCNWFWMVADLVFCRSVWRQ